MDGLFLHTGSIHMITSSCKWCFLLFMVLLVPLPERLGHIVGKFRDVLSKSQFENFQSVMFGLIVSHCKEHDVKSIRDAISETKCQSEH